MDIKHGEQVGKRIAVQHEWNGAAGCCGTSFRREETTDRQTIIHELRFVIGHCDNEEAAEYAKLFRNEIGTDWQEVPIVIGELRCDDELRAKTAELERLTGIAEARSDGAPDIPKLRELVAVEPARVKGPKA
jgi:hypothetical protein